LKRKQTTAIRLSLPLLPVGLSMHRAILLP